LDLLAILGPIFLVIGAGFAAVRSGYMAAAGIRPLSEVVIKVALPALMISSFARNPLAEIVRPEFVAGYGLGSLAAFGLGLVLFRRGFGLTLEQSAALGMGMATSNSGFVGYPVAHGLIGPEAAGLILAQCMIVENLLMLPLGSSLRGGGGTWATLRTTLAGMLRSPIVIAIAVGLAISATRTVLPAEVLGALDLLKQIAAPLALFVLGATLAALPLGGVMGPVAVVTAGKLALHPALVFGAMWLFGASPALTAAATLFAAMPMLSIFPIIAQRARIEGLAATALVAATASSFVTLVLVTGWLDLAG